MRAAIPETDPPDARTCAGPTTRAPQFQPASGSMAQPRSRTARARLQLQMRIAFPKGKTGRVRRPAGSLRKTASHAASPNAGWLATAKRRVVGIPFPVAATGRFETAPFPGDQISLRAIEGPAARNPRSGSLGEHGCDRSVPEYIG